MALKIEDIDSAEKLEEYLDKQPKELSQIIAYRCALRVLPSLQSAFSDQHKHRFVLTQSVLRCNLISWVARNYPTHDMTIYAAASAAFAASAAASSSAAFAAASASAASSASAAAAAAAFAAAAAARAAVWKSIQQDLTLFQDKGEGSLIDSALWHEGIPEIYQENWSALKQSLLGDSSDWQVWTDWYEHVLHGEKSPKRGIAALSDEMLIEFAQKPNKFWERDSDIVNAEIVGWVGPSGSRSMLATLTTPEPFVNENGELDVQPNSIYDKPEVDDDLVELPIRQLSVIKTIKSELNSEKSNIAPNGLFESFAEYENELLARGTQPFVGVLSDQADIILGYMNAKFAKEEWMQDGVGVACEKFLDNHAKILKHFPLDQDRENEFENYSLVEETKSDPIFNKCYKETIDIVRAAKQEGITSDEFLRVLEKRLEHAKIVSSLPEQDKNTAKIKKKAVLKDIGFWDKTLDRMDKIRKFSESETGKQLYSKGKELADWLGSFINFSG